MASKRSISFRGGHRSDRFFAISLGAISLALPILLLLLTISLTRSAWPSIAKFGASFIWKTAWDPVQDVYGAWPVIYGTLVSSFLALLIAGPLSVGVALFLSEVVPRKLATVLSFLIELLAAIPSVVYGFWGIFVLAPILREYIEPFLGHTLGFLPFFQGSPFGLGMLSAAVILAIMICPTITSISREIFRAVPRDQRDAALALGSTRWESMRVAVLGNSQSGIFGAFILGLGRALGETMAVTMVIGNRSEVSLSLFDPSQTMASVIANEYAEATSRMHLAALAEVGLLLLLITLFVNGMARFLIWKTHERKRK